MWVLDTIPLFSWISPFPQTAVWKLAVGWSSFRSATDSQFRPYIYRKGYTRAIFAVLNRKRRIFRNFENTLLPVGIIALYSYYRDFPCEFEMA